MFTSKVMIVIHGLLLCMVICTNSAFADANEVIPKDEKDIQSINSLVKSFGVFADKARACMKEPGGSSKSCLCGDLDSCKVKEEFKKTANLYCKIKLDHPSWAGKDVSFYVEEQKKYNSLSMRTFESTFGGLCK